MGKLCMYCLEEYKNDHVMTPYKSSESGLYQDCPKRACEGKVYTVDDNLIPTISILNSKGYPTHGSCAGHHLEVDTECYIEFTEAVKSVPVLPEGFKLRMRTIEGKARLSIYRKPVSDDPVDQHAELLDIADELYDWALDLDFNIDGMNVVLIDIDQFNSVSFFDSFFDPQDAPEKDKKEKPKKKLNVDKLKEASIKFNKPAADESSKEQEDQKDIPPAEENKEKVTKKKPGRSKKNQD